MISLNDDQLACLMAHAAALDWQKRSDFLLRVAGLLRLQSGRPTDADVSRAADQALRSLGAVNTAALSITYGRPCGRSAPALQ